MTDATQTIHAVAASLGFIGSVVTRRNAADEDGTVRPARGDGPLVLALLHITRTRSWLRDAPIVWVHVSVTHVESGFAVGSMENNPIEHGPPVKPWLIPATEAGARLAEDMRQAYLALGLPWERTPLPSEIDVWTTAVRSVVVNRRRAVKIEREAAKLFKADLQAREWYLTKTRTAEVIRDEMRARFPWYGRARKKAAQAG